MAREFRAQATQAEGLLRDRLESRQVAGAKFRRQHPVDRFVVDFCFPKAGVVIQLDGSVHPYSVEEDTIR